MTTALQTTRPGAFWNDADVALVRAKCAENVNDQEWRLFLHLANLYRLDPLARQIYCLKYGDKPAQIFAGVDGFLAIAQRSERLDGMEVPCRVEPVPFTVSFYDNRKKERITFAQDTQFVATATVWVKGWAHPVRVEIWEEEYSTGRDLWATKRRTMTAKVALCQALRKAFNISGLYDRDEVGTAAYDPETLTVDATEVDTGTGEIKGQTRESVNLRKVLAEPAPQRTERPPAVSGVQSPASAPATAPAPRVVAPVGDPLTLAKATTLLLVKPFGWDDRHLTEIMETVITPGIRIGQAGLTEWRALYAYVQKHGRDALAGELFPEPVAVGAV